jgi:hypothetical protein
VLRTFECLRRFYGFAVSMCFARFYAFGVSMCFARLNGFAVSRFYAYGVSSFTFQWLKPFEGFWVIK